MNSKTNTKTFYICDPAKATECPKISCYQHGGPCYAVSDKALALEPICEVDLQCATNSLVRDLSAAAEKLQVMLHTAERHIAASSLEHYVALLREASEGEGSDISTDDIRQYCSEYVVMNTVGEADDPDDLQVRI